MENKKFFIKNISELELSNNINLNSSTIYSSSYKNMLLFLINNNLFYKGKYIEQPNSNNFIFEKIESNTNKSNIINLQQKFISCDFTSNYIYFITKNKNEILYSNYLSNENNNNEIITILPGIIQKKKIKSISCGINSTLFLTYGGMVYSNYDKNKENQKLITDLLEYNIDQIYSGAQHYFCVGQKRNISEGGSIVFSWGNNTLSQCGFDSQINNIENPKMIFKNIFIKEISLGNNHSMILTSNGEVLMFGDNQNNQCSPENKKFIKLIENDDIIPITEINYYISPIDYLVKNNEKIIKIEAKNDSSMIITDKKSIIFRGKIFDGKEKIFKLHNNNNEHNSNNNLLYCFGGDNFFLTLNNNDNNNLYTEIKNSNNYIINNYKKIKLYNNSDNKAQKKSFNEEEDEAILSSNTKTFQQRSITPINNNKYKTISFQNDLTFEELKKEQNKALMTNADISEDTLTELRSYISLLGISFSSSYNDSNLSFRPKNLPPKSKEEENLHKQLVLQNRQMYINVLKQKQELEKMNLLNLEQKHKQEKIKAEFWTNKIIPNWSKMKNNKNIKKYFFEGIPNMIRGKIWSLCIGNKFSITKEYYDIEAKKSIQLLMKLEKNSHKKNQNDESDLSSSMSLTTKKIYSKYIKQTLDKEKSINLIDLDIERTFPYMGVFKENSQLGENLREILRIFVVARPDIGYVQGLSYIAGTLLLQMDKFQAFVCFMNIILSPNILPFYLLDEQNIKKRLDLFNDIFKINLPELFEHFKENEVMPEHYLLEWLMTLYTRNVYIDLAFRIWDIYMIEGIMSLYKTAIVIFSIHQKDYLQMEFSDILNHLKNLETNKYNEDKFIEAMNKVKFNDKIMNKIHQLNEEYLLYE
jgi:hypothetical protein